MKAKLDAKPVRSCVAVPDDMVLDALKPGVLLPATFAPLRVFFVSAFILSVPDPSTPSKPIPLLDPYC
ncbi:hypothetical protein D3C80_1568920 [compost metagenome]